MRVERVSRSIAYRVLLLSALLVAGIYLALHFSANRLRAQATDVVKARLACVEIDRLRAGMATLPDAASRDANAAPFPATFDIHGMAPDVLWQITMTGNAANRIRARGLVRRDQTLPASPEVVADTAEHSYELSFLGSRFLVCEAVRPVSPSFNDYYGVEVEEIRYHVAVPVSTLAGVAEQLGEDIARSQIPFFLGISLTAIGLLVLGVYWLFSRGTTQLTASIAQVRSGSATRISDELPTELAAVRSSINQLLDHHQGLVKRTRQFMGKIAHDLNNRAQAIAAMMAREGEIDRSEILGALASMKMLVERYQSLSRTSVGASANTENPLSARTNVLDSLHKIVGVQKFNVHGQDVDFEYDVDNPKLTFLGHEGDLDAIVSNLLLNAAKYGNGRVRVNASLTDRVFNVVVEDDGPGIPADVVSRIFEFGQRFDNEMPGSGFGLTIVRDVAQVYQGKVEIDRSPALGGARFSVVFPKSVARVFKN